MEIQGELTVTNVLAQYAAGRRDFRGLEIGPDNNASFDDINLDGADFSGSFVDASFAGASLRGAKFINANVKACCFDRSDLEDATFAGSAIDAASFTRANLARANFCGATEQSHTFGAHELPRSDAADPIVGGRHHRFRQALCAQRPFDALHKLAIDLRDEGETQKQLLGLFGLFQRERSSDRDELLYHAILDVMDYIVGWCRPEAALFRADHRGT